MQATVVIPTHNPRRDALQKVLGALRRQTLGLAEWELVIVDNASDPPVQSQVDIGWHPQGRFVREEKVGLTAARLAGFAAAQGDLVVLVDDDNVLSPDYLAVAVAIGREHPFLGAWSGTVVLDLAPGINPPPPEWRSYLTERLPVQPTWSNDPSHNDSTPWGAGMCVRRTLAAAYTQRSRQNPDLLRLDLHGANLVYGGDTDIAFHGCTIGMGKGVFPQLKLRHLIPAQRCDRDYLVKVIEAHAYSEWLHHWVLHRRLPPQPKARLDAVKRCVRFLTSSTNERAADAARQRGHARAARELSRVA